MGQTLLADLTISLAPERLDEGTPEERSAFGLFTVIANGLSLTAGYDSYINATRQGPLVSAYFSAEWFAWNWWRLLFEPRSKAPDWHTAHHMPSIGEGYIWPNLTIFSDGIRTALVSKRSIRTDAKPFRYLGERPVVVPSSVFEDSLDTFIPCVISRLHDEGLRESNLEEIWRGVILERRDQDLAKRRQLEALLGLDPSTENDVIIDHLLASEASLGSNAIRELAASNFIRNQSLPITATAGELSDMAKTYGASSSASTSLSRKLRMEGLPDSSVPAWKVGADSAKALRNHTGIGYEPITDALLAEIAGTRVSLLHDSSSQAPFSFEWRYEGGNSRVALRSKWVTGRRFELARLIGDRIMGPQETLKPATGSNTYRQKAQRAFAAEFLSPFDQVDQMASDDYSEETLQDIASHFNVSVLTISTLLTNHGRVERDLEDSDWLNIA